MVKSLFKVFIDANVIFSGFYKTESHSGKILQLHQSQDIQLMTCGQVMGEVVRNIANKVPSALPPVFKFFYEYPFEVTPNATKSEIKKWSQLLPFEDAIILSAARLARADFFVTGNHKHFTRKVTESSGLVIVSPKQLIETIEEN